MLHLGCLPLAAPGVLAQEFDDAFYEELDAFALALNGVQALSSAQNVEFCGYYALDADQQIAVTPPTRGDADSGLSADPPPGFRGAGVMAATISTPMPRFPRSTICSADIDEQIDGYVATPGGRVWLNLYEEETAVMLCGAGCIAVDTDSSSAGRTDDLQRRFDNDPGYC